MPRKKRKLSGVRPLVFVESPVNIVHNVPSPVYCSDHPATADVVPIEGNVTWVSPQFTKVPGSCRPTRRTRRTNRSAVETQHTTQARTRHQNHTLPVHGASDKYKPLVFLGEPERKDDDVSSICDDITMEDDPERITCDLNPVESGSNNKSVRKSLVYPDDPDRRKSNPGASPCVRSTACDFNTPDLSTLQLNTPKTLRDENKFTNIKRKLSDVLDTPPRPMSNHKKRARHLYSIGDDNGDEFDSLPCRRSQRLHKMTENFFPNSQLSTPKFKQPLDILVYDTPEEEYGIPLRRRQLRNTRLANKIR